MTSMGACFVCIRRHLHPVVTTLPPFYEEQTAADSGHSPAEKMPGIITGGRGIGCGGGGGIYRSRAASAPPKRPKQAQYHPTYQAQWNYALTDGTVFYDPYTHQPLHPAVEAKPLVNLFHQSPRNPEYRPLTPQHVSTPGWNVMPQPAAPAVVQVVRFATPETQPVYPGQLPPIPPQYIPAPLGVHPQLQPIPPQYVPAPQVVHTPQLQPIPPQYIPASSVTSPLPTGIYPTLTNPEPNHPPTNMPCPQTQYQQPAFNPGFSQ